VAGRGERGRSRGAGGLCGKTRTRRNRLIQPSAPSACTGSVTVFACTSATCRPRPRWRLSLNVNVDGTAEEFMEAIRTRRRRLGGVPGGGPGLLPVGVPQCEKAPGESTGSLHRHSLRPLAGYWRSRWLAGKLPA
jgi:hypothetical protein